VDEGRVIMVMMDVCIMCMGVDACGWMDGRLVWEDEGVVVWMRVV